jgi:hypothetical protein
MTSVKRVTALIDWDTAKRVWPVKQEHKLRDLEQIIGKLQGAIATYLSAIESESHFRVRWRMYHGWHRGKSKTADRLIFERYVRSARSRNIRKSFGADFTYSETLSCNTHRAPLFDTLRRDEYTAELRQKMVDTALVCDLLHLVRTRDSHMYMIVADDDDFVPALFTAESWNGKVVLLHRRPSLNAHLDLKGLVSRMDLRD